MTVAKKSLEVPELREEIRAGRLSLSKSKEMVRAVSKERIALRLEVSDQVHAKLRRVQNVLSSKDHINASLEDCVAAMVDVFLRRYDPLVRGKGRSLRASLRLVG